MSVVRNVTVKLGVDLKAFSTQLSRAANQVSKASKNFTKMGTSMTQKVTMPIAGVGLASIKTAADFEQSMSKLRATMGLTSKDATKQYDIMRTKARELGRSTTKSASEVANGMEYMALAGWETTEILKGIEPVLHLSEAGMIDLGRASDLVTDSMGAFGLNVDQLKPYLDKLAKGSTRANSDIVGFMEAVINVGGVLDGMNVSMDEAITLLGVMGNKGIKASEAGNALSSFMISLTSGIGNTQKALDNMNYSIWDSEGNFKGMRKVLIDLNGILNGYTQEQRESTKALLAGKIGTKTLNALLGATGEEYDDLQKEIEGSTGALGKMRNEMQNNLYGELAKLKSALQDVGITIGDKLLDPIKNLTVYLQKLTEWFSKLSPETISVIMVLAGIAAAIGPILLVIGQLITSIGGIMTAFSTVSGVLAGTFAGLPIAPILAIVAAIVAIGAAVIKIKFGNFKNFVAALKEMEFVKNLGKIFTDIKNTIVEWATVAGEYFTKFKDMFVEGIKQVDFTGFKKALTSLVETLGRIWEAVKPLAEIIGVVLLAAIGLIIAAIPMVVQWFSSLMAIVVEVINIIVNLKTLIVQLVSALITGDWGSVVDTLKSIWDSIINIITEAIGGLLSGIFNFINMIIGYFTGDFATLPTNVQEIWDIITNATQDFVQSVWGWIVDKWNAIKDFTVNTWNTIKTDMSNNMSAIYDNTIGKLITLVGDIRTRWQEIKETFKTGVNDIKTKMKNLAKKALEYGENLITNLIEGIKKKMKDLKTWASNIANTIADYVGFMSPTKKGVGKNADKWGANLVKMYGKTMIKNSKYVKNAVNYLSKYLTKLQVKDMILDLNKLEKEEDIKPYFRALGDDIYSELEKIQNKAKSIMNFTDIFGAFDTKVISGTKLYNNLQGQVKAMKEYTSVMDVMKQKLGGRSLLYQKLESMGVGALNEIKALNRLNNSKLLEYLAMYNEKSNLAQNLAQADYTAEMLTNRALGGIVMNITGNKISNEEDVIELTNQIVKNLKLQGVF